MSSQLPTHINVLADRFALRLRELLNDLGYPGRLVDRTRQLSYALGLDDGVTSALLSGHLLPDYEVLLALCRLGNRNPGWFLDAEPVRLPPGVVVAHPLGPGPELVLHIPADFLVQPPPSAKVSYWRAKSDMGFGVISGDYVFSLSVPMDSKSILEKRLYLVGDYEGFEIRLCQSVARDRILFVNPSGTHMPCILPADQNTFRDSGLSEAIHHSGLVIGILRDSDRLLLQSRKIDFILG